MSNNKQELKEGFEFLQPILDNGIELPFVWSEKYNGYYNADDDEVLLADGKLYRPIALQRDRMILKYENGEIEKDSEYERLKQWQNSENQMKIVDADGQDALIFDVEKYIILALVKRMNLNNSYGMPNHIFILTTLVLFIAITVGVINSFLIGSIIYCLYCAVVMFIYRKKIALAEKNLECKKGESN